MNKIVLDHITIDNNLVKYDFHTNEELKVYFMTDNLFIQYEEDMTSVPLSILTIPFVNIMAGLSWVSDAMLFVDEIDKTYYDAFQRIKVAYNELHHVLFKGMLVPSRFVNNCFRTSQDKSILLFGGGVDCHTSFLRNRDSVSKIVNIYGWLKDIDEKNDVDISDANGTKDYAMRMGGVDSVHVRSNFAAMFNHSTIDTTLCNPVIKTSYWYGLLHPMAFLSIAAPLAWMYQISRLIIASSFAKGRTNVHCASYITTDSVFCFANEGHTIHDGFELDRQDKVKYLVDYQRTTGMPYYIQACSFNDHNCCVCEKCFRTIVELVSENADPRDFGFNHIQGRLKDHWGKVISKDIAMWGVAKESYYYKLSSLRMRENYEKLDDEQREFVDWFLSFDFVKAKREGLRKYYRKNFFKIIKRKLHI